MAIITLAEWKSLTGTTGTTYDTQVTALIPYVEDDFIAMCNYDFGAGTTDEDFPDGCKLYVAKMINWLLNNMASDGEVVKSESINGDSYTLADVGKAGYPAPLESAITSKWRRASFKSTSSDLLQYRDKRGFTPEQLDK